MPWDQQEPEAIACADEKGRGVCHAYLVRAGAVMLVGADWHWESVLGSQQT